MARILGPGAFQAGEGDPEPGLIQALRRTQPSVACLEVLPLGVEVGRQIVVALGGVGVIVGEQASSDLQRFLEKRLGLDVLSLGSEVDRQVAIAAGGQRVVIGEEAEVDLQRFSKSGWASAYFPWPPR